MKLSLENDCLVMRLAWWEKLLGVHGDLGIRRGHIVRAGVEPPATLYRIAGRVGTQVPGVFTLGTFYPMWYRGKGEFWYFRRRRDLLVLELAGEELERVVVQLPPGENRRWVEILRPQGTF